MAASVEGPQREVDLEKVASAGTPSADKDEGVYKGGEASACVSWMSFLASNREVVVLPLSLIILVIFTSVELDSTRPLASEGAAVLLITALWWFTEVLPLTITSLLPMVLYPMLGVASVKTLSAKFFKSTTFLFVAGFFIGLAVERWDLHTRVVCTIVRRAGSKIELVIGGFMFSVWLLSMWISNTATILCMLPMAQAFLDSLPPGHERFQSCFLLAVGYAATIGGIATPVGTPTNGIFMSQFSDFWPEQGSFSFATFMLCAVPLSAMLLCIVWLGFVSVFVWAGKDRIPVDQGVFEEMRLKLGKLTYEQMVVTADLLLLVVLWFTGSRINDFPGWRSVAFEDMNSSAVGLALTLPLFFVPCGARLPRVVQQCIGEDRCLSQAPGPMAPRNILDWAAVKDGFRWEILFVFGGGAIIADGTVRSGLAAWVAEQLASLAVGDYLFLMAVTFVICFVTEVVSNMATLAIFGSIIATTASMKGLDPVKYLLGVCFASSFAFMLPMAGGPNMVVYSTGRVPVSTMAKFGVLLNCVAIFLGGSYVALVVPALLGPYQNLGAPIAG